MEVYADFCRATVLLGSQTGQKVSETHPMRQPRQKSRARRAEKTRERDCAVDQLEMCWDAANHRTSSLRLCNVQFKGHTNMIMITTRYRRLKRR